MSRLLFISAKNRWFYRATLLACCFSFAMIILAVNPHAYTLAPSVHFELLHHTLAYVITALVAGLTMGALYYQKQFSLAPFMIGLITTSLAITQLLLCHMAVMHQTNPTVVFAHLFVGVSILSLLWWMGRLTSPDIPGMTHSSTHKWRAWAWLALAMLVGQIALGTWVSANFDAGCNDFPFCHGKLIPTISSSTVNTLLHPLNAVSVATLTDIRLVHQYAIVAAALYLSFFSLVLLFNRYLYQVAFFMVLLLSTQVALNFYALGWPHPTNTVFYYYAVSMLLLLTVITLLAHLYRQTQDYWYG